MNTRNPTGTNEHDGYHYCGLVEDPPMEWSPKKLENGQTHHCKVCEQNWKVVNGWWSKVNE